MPSQRLSLYGSLPSRALETFVTTVQNLTSADLTQFKTLTHVYKDETLPQGRRASDFIRLRFKIQPSTRDGVLEVVDAPEMNKRPVTSIITHIVPCTSGDLKALVVSMGYHLAFSYFEQGYRLMIGSVRLRIYQIFKAVEDATGESIEGNADAELQGLVIGDGSTWIVQGDVDVKSGTPDDLKKGTEELLRLKRDLQGYIELTALIDELR